MGQQMFNPGYPNNMNMKYPQQQQMMNPQLINNYGQQKPRGGKTQNKHVQPQNIQDKGRQQPQEKDDIDYNLLDTLDDDNAKKDYLGEFIFKKIENHKLSQINNFTIDSIGKITGMILGIEDINEIIDICKNPDNLTSRISEAMELLWAIGGQKA